MVSLRLFQIFIPVGNVFPNSTARTPSVSTHLAQPYCPQTYLSFKHLSGSKLKAHLRTGRIQTEDVNRDERGPGG